MVELVATRVDVPFPPEVFTNKSHLPSSSYLSSYGGENRVVCPICGKVSHPDL